MNDSKGKVKKTYKKKISTNDARNRVKTKSNKKSTKSSVNNTQSSAKENVKRNTIKSTGSLQRSSSYGNSIQYNNTSKINDNASKNISSTKEIYSNSKIKTNVNRSSQDTIQSTLGKKKEIRGSSSYVKIKTSSINQAIDKGDNTSNSKGCIKTGKLLRNSNSHAKIKTSSMNLDTDKGVNVSNSKSRIKTGKLLRDSSFHAKIKTSNMNPDIGKEINVSNSKSRIKTGKLLRDLKTSSTNNAEGKINTCKIIHPGIKTKNIKLQKIKLKNGKKITKLRTSRIGMLNILKGKDSTTDVTATTVYLGLQGIEKVINAGKLSIRTTRGSLKFAKKILIDKNKILTRKSIKKLTRFGAKKTIKTMKGAPKETIKRAYNILESSDKTDNLMANAIYHNIEYTKKAVNVAKKTINTTKALTDVRKKIIKKVSRRKSLARNRKRLLVGNGKLFTKRKVIFNKGNQQIFTKVKLRRIGKKNLYKSKFKKALNKKIINMAIKIRNKTIQLISNIFTKPKGFVGILAIALLVVLMVSMVSLAAGSQSIATLVPNIENPQEWINMCNTLDQKKNREIHSGNKFVLVNGNTKADWRDVIAVCMAKYNNEPPINSSSQVGGSTASTSGPVITGQQTIFKGTYSDIINKAAQQTGVDASLIAGIIKQESDFNPKEVSYAGAMGLMQLMPENCQEYGVSNPFDPYQNIMGGAKQLSDLIKLYNGNLTLVLAGYNAGIGNVQKYGGVPPFRETQNYVRIVMANYEAYRQGKPLPEGEITGVIGGDNFLSEFYNLFNTITQTRTTEETSHGHKRTIVTITLTRHNMEYVMDKLNFTNEQKEMATAMREADLFKEVMPNFDFKFKLDIPQGAESGPIDTNINIEVQTTNKTRKDIINKGLELVGKVPYFWGGKSGPGWNNAWGKDAIVTAGGSKSTGSIRPYGLDCSGFVAWVYDSVGITSAFQQGGTGLQWQKSYEIRENELLPGDLVFNADCSHVGIFYGKDNGQNTFIECSSSKGVTVSHNPGFTVFRRPYINFGDDKK